jgi:hypothetical protein
MHSARRFLPPWTIERAQQRDLIILAAGASERIASRP